MFVYIYYRLDIILLAFSFCMYCERFLILSADRI